MHPLVLIALKLIEPALREVLPNSAQTDRIMQEVRLKAMDLDAASIRAAATALMTELSSESWLARSWRPLMMFLMGTVIGFVLVVMPLMNVVVFPLIAFLWNTTLGCVVPEGACLPVQPTRFDVSSIPAEIWQILMISIPGYMAVRGGEKIASTITGRDASSASRGGVIEQITKRLAPSRTATPINHELAPDIDLGASSGRRKRKRPADTFDLPLEGGD